MDTSKPPTKYRASCDGCYLAKLKCSKEKPTCPRCNNLGITCTYSPSQRTGKQRASKSQASSSSTTTTSSSTTPTAPSASHVLDWQPTASSQTSTIMPTETLAQAFEKSPFPPTNDLPQSPLDTTMSNWPNSATMLTDLDTDLLAPWRTYLPNIDKDDPFFKISDDLVGGLTRLAPEPSDCQSLNSQNLHACNCFDSMTQTLLEMHTQSLRPSTPALEATLSCSKQVTARGEVLLHCPCTEDSTPMLLFAALIAKYLSLYATNMDLTTSSSSSTSLADIAPDALSSSSSRLTIGRYTMDAEDEERLRTEIVMMELGKVNTLLMKFRGKFSSSMASPLGAGGYEGHTYETVLGFLNTRLGEAMGRLQVLKQKYSQPAS